MNTELYEEFYATYFSTIKMWLNKAKIDYQNVDDVASDIVLKIIEKDGMGKYDSNRGAKVNTYLNKYVFLTSRSYREKETKRKINELHIDVVPHTNTFNNESFDYSLFDYLENFLDGDSLEFFQHAVESNSYTQARKCLSDKGWDKKRITTAVLLVRKATKKYFSKVPA